MRAQWEPLVKLYKQLSIVIFTNTTIGYSTIFSELNIT